MRNVNITDQNKKCGQINCPVAVSGECLEGLSLDECPHYYLNNSTEEEEEEEEEGQNDISNILEDSVEYITFHSGNDLDSDETDRITYKYNSSLIVIFGESDSGKTTLAATIHELFQISTFKGFWYAGSSTLIGFEKRCHQSRLQSGNAKARTEKTKSSDFKFLHIALKEEDKLQEDAVHLIVSDVSGERYRLARNSSDNMKELTILKYAHRVIITLDGQKLGNRKTVNLEIINAKTFIRKALEEEIFSSSTPLCIVITKWDLLGSDQNFSLDNLKLQFDSTIKGKIKEVNYVLVAARPDLPTEEIPLGYGIDTLLKDWLTPFEYFSLKGQNNTFYDKNTRQFLIIGNSMDLKY